MSRRAIRRAYPLLCLTVLVLGLPTFWLGAGFAGGVGSALNGFRLGLASGNLAGWLFLLPLLLLPVYWWAGRGRDETTSSVWARIGIGGACLFGLLLLFAQIEDTPVAQLPSACHRGAWRLADGRVMAVSVSPVAALDFRLSDGSRAMTWTGDHLSFSGTSCLSAAGASLDDFSMAALDCRWTRIIVDTHDRPPQFADRIRLVETAADFHARRHDIRGRLFLPAGDAPVPLIILPAQRNGSSQLDWGHEQYMLGGLGIAVFAYDLPERWPFGAIEIEDDGEAAEIAAAAFARARRIVGRRATRIGFFGGRDALLASARTPAAFVVADTSQPDESLLRRIAAPVLILAAGADEAVRSGGAAAAVRRLQAERRRVDLLVFPAADRHMRRHATRGGGQCEAGEPLSYHPSIAAWIAAGTLAPGDDAVLTATAAEPR